MIWDDYISKSIDDDFHHNPTNPKSVSLTHRNEQPIAVCTTSTPDKPLTCEPSNFIFITESTSENDIIDKINGMIQENSALLFLEQDDILVQQEKDEFVWDKYQSQIIYDNLHENKISLDSYARKFEYIIHEIHGEDEQALEFLKEIFPEATTT